MHVFLAIWLLLLAIGQFVRATSDDIPVEVDVEPWLYRTVRFVHAVTLSVAAFYVSPWAQ